MSLLGSIVGVIGSRQAAKAQEKAANQASDTQRYIFEQNRQDQMPWMQAGRAGLDELLYGLGIKSPSSAGTGREDFDAAAYLQANPDAAEYMRTSGRDAYDHWVADGMRRAFTRNAESQARLERNQQAGSDPRFGSLLRDFGASDFQQDPGYQFRLEQGEGAINRNALARGRFNSGATLKALQDFNSGLASQEYGNAFNRFRAQQGDRYNRIAGLAGVGQSATNQVNADRSAMGNAISNNIICAGNARSAGIVGMANSINNGLSQATNWLTGQQGVNSLSQRGSPAMFRGQMWGGGAGDQWYG